MTKVLVVDDKESMRDSVAATLARAGLAAVAAPSGRAAIELAGKHRPSAVITDLKMPQMDGIALLAALHERDPQLPVVLMTAFASLDTAIEALRLGAFDYLQKPFEGDELVATMRRAVEHYTMARENAAMKRQRAESASSRPLIGRCRAMQQLRSQIDQIAASHGTVLITGESGTGKEVVAHALHEQSPRADQVMLCLNCAALSATLLESELFGHEKGAFTGADQMRKGRFELAEGGTLLLDEISEIGPTVQAKLLRVLQERQFERVGSSQTMHVDVRIIATTNRDLEHEARSGRFRQDLFFRLNVLPIRLPALRERASDIPLLADHFLEQAAVRDGQPAKRFDDEAMALLCEYDWPGNVRELQNICERACVLTQGPVIEATTISPWLRGTMSARGCAEVELEIADGWTLEEIERQVILRTLDRHRGHRQRTADALGIGLRTLGLKLKKWKEENLVSPGV